MESRSPSVSDGELQNVTSLVSTEGEKLRLGTATASATVATRRRTGLEVPHQIAELVLRINIGFIPLISYVIAAN